MFRRIFFNLWYLFRRPPWDSGVTPPELLAFIENNPPGNALDLGCGTGTNVITVARAGWQVTGVDFAAPAIGKARRKADNAGVKADFRAGDVTRIEFPSNSFDLILDIGCFHGLEPEGRTDYARKVQSWLRPGGTFLLYGVLDQSSDARIGIADADLGLFNTLSLSHREDGVNSGPMARPSAWFTYIKLDPQ